MCFFFHERRAAREDRWHCGYKAVNISDKLRQFIMRVHDNKTLHLSAITFLSPGTLSLRREGLISRACSDQPKAAAARSIAVGALPPRFVCQCVCAQSCNVCVDKPKASNLQPQCCFSRRELLVIWKSVPQSEPVDAFPGGSCAISLVHACKRVHSREMRFWRASERAGLLFVVYINAEGSNRLRW
jgi:hypothetical protein